MCVCVCMNKRETKNNISCQGSLWIGRESECSISDGMLSTAEGCEKLLLIALLFQMWSLATWSGFFDEL